MAKLRFTYGTMCTGKSLQLLTTIYNFEQRGIKTLCLKSSLDTRDKDKIRSRVSDKLSRDCILINEKTDLHKMLSDRDDISDIKWIFLDEAQFLTEEQVNQLSDIVDYLNIEVWCFGLRTDFKTQLFPGSKRLFELADKIDCLKSSCECGRKNVVNARISPDGKLVLNGLQIETGDSNYISICRKCYKEMLKTKTI